MRYQFAVFVFVVGLVRLLASPEVFDRLTYHTPPKELSPEAVTEDWPRFLGPRHDLHSRETRLMKSFPDKGPNKVWEIKRGSGHAPVVVVGDYLVAIHELDGLETI
ncbi:MAG: hypothetical protein MK240_09965, partial [Opitutales bacterium]|nr:hypothetical protein [Opitutales bacterium]